MRLLCDLSTGPVITTNFDRLLERTFELAGKRFEVIVCGAKPDMINRAMQQSRRRLLKLHGDWEESTDRILTKSEYDRHYGAGASPFTQTLPLPRILKALLTGRSVLFLRCLGGHLKTGH